MIEDWMRALPTFVFTICNFLVLDPGLSPAPTKATRLVQNSISTIEHALSSE